MNFSKSNTPTSPGQYWAKESEDGKPFVATVVQSEGIGGLVSRKPGGLFWRRLDVLDWLWGDRVEYTEAAPFSARPITGDELCLCGHKFGEHGPNLNCAMFVESSPAPALERQPLTIEAIREALKSSVITASALAQELKPYFGAATDLVLRTPAPAVQQGELKRYRLKYRGDDFAGIYPEIPKDPHAWYAGEAFYLASDVDARDAARGAQDGETPLKPATVDELYSLHETEKGFGTPAYSEMYCRALDLERRLRADLAVLTEEERGSLVGLVKYIEREVGTGRFPRFSRDHACSECLEDYPPEGRELVKAGFQCAWHKARAVSLRLSTPSAQGLRPEVRKIVAFLCGEAPLEGVWFGDNHPQHKGKFWWRSRLRAALSATKGEAG